MPTRSGVQTGPNDRATPGVPRPATNWLAHLALILAAAGVAVILADRGYENLPRVLSIGVLIVLLLVFAAQFVIVRRAGGALGNGAAYALCTAGALCMLVAAFVQAKSALIALAILTLFSFLSGIVAFVLQIQRLRRP